MPVIARRRIGGALIQFLGAAVGALLVGGAAIGIANSATDPQPSRADRAELTAYERAIAAPAKEGGFVVQEGLKVGLAQVGSGNAGQVMFQAVAWVERIKTVRTEFDAAAAPLTVPTLIEAAEAFDEALVLYERTAETIGAAAIASGDPRVTLLEKAAASGKKADARYDKAMALIQSTRKALKMPATEGLPSPGTENE
ncbi:MAG TPA: hypothetical protein VF230_16925 [Acidimicrobiales bacterium]